MGKARRQNQRYSLSNYQKPRHAVTPYVISSVRKFKNFYSRDSKWEDRAVLPEIEGLFINLVYPIFNDAEEPIIYEPDEVPTLNESD